MSNELSPDLLSQILAQESDDPFLALLTLSHPSFPTTYRFVNNSVDVVSRGETFIAFPFKIRLPVDDGESPRDVSVEMDNVDRRLVDFFRSVTGPINVKLEMILGSIPNDVQMEIDELKLQNITYNTKRISGKLLLDNFLNVTMTSEKYAPKTYPGLF